MNIEQKTITSVEVAEMVGKTHNELLKDMRRYSEQLGEVNIPQSDFFIESTYFNSQNKELPCYNVTKKGCEFIGNKLTGIKGTEFTAKYINKFHDMEQVITTNIKPLTDREIMRLQLEMIDGVVDRVEKLENNMTIDYGQQQVLKERVNKVVVKSLGGKGTNAYKNISKIVFSECNKDIQQHFNVNSRNNIPKLKYEDAIKYIEVWNPCTNTQFMINDWNNQLTLK